MCIYTEFFAITKADISVGNILILKQKEKRKEVHVTTR